MVGVVTFKIIGGQNLEKRLRDLGPIVATKIGDNSLAKSALPITKLMRSYVPVRTGALKKSITTRNITTSKANGSLRVRVIGFKSPGRYYAHLVEFGTVHSAAKPFIRPALDAAAGSAILEMGKEIFRGIEAYAIGSVLTSLDTDKD